MLALARAGVTSAAVPVAAELVAEIERARGPVAELVELSTARARRAPTP
jgi:hypothetical protein